MIETSEASDIRIRPKLYGYMLGSLSWVLFFYLVVYVSLFAYWLLGSKPYFSVTMSFVFAIHACYTILLPVYLCFATTYIISAEQRKIISSIDLAFNIKRQSELQFAEIKHVSIVTISTNTCILYLFSDNYKSDFVKDHVQKNFFQMQFSMFYYKSDGFIGGITMDECLEVISKIKTNANRDPKIGGM